MEPAPSAAAASGAPADLQTGLITTPMPSAQPPALRVTAIGWFSGFRGTALRVGDQIVAVDSEPVRLPVPAAQAASLVGGYDEKQRWAQAGRRAGDGVRLQVRRRATPGQGWQTLDISGTLQPPVNVRSADNRILIGPGGPPEMYENDGFDCSWRQWADAFAKRTAAVLDDPLYALALTTPYELRSLLEIKPRVERLAQKYPGPFADAVTQDFDAMLQRLQGPAVALSDDALAYRELGEQRAQAVREQAQTAWAALQAELASQMVAPVFPAVHPIHGERAAVIGRYVALPPLRNRDWVGEAGRTWFVAGSASDGWYFADAEGAEAVWMQDALARYRRLVVPTIDETYQLIGQVQEQPGQLVMGERAYFGLRLRPVAALIGGALFVDLRQSKEGSVRFAGEDSLRSQGAALPPDTASPQEVLQAMVQALKMADQDLWLALFATWSVERMADGRPLFRANAVEQPARYFEEARRRIMERVFDMRRVWVDDVQVVFSGEDYPGQPRLEEVTVEMQHMGRFEDQFRPFGDVTVNRWWRLQRMGPPGHMGPWRITSLQPI